MPDNRFSRQVMMRAIGEKGQRIIKKTHVVVVGAGGLGCPVLSYLASAGIGKVTIIDCDTVSISNLNRQFLYSENDIGKSKAELAAKRISSQYPSTVADGISQKLDIRNIAELTRGADIIVDCVDNIKTRLAVNDFAVKNGISLVEAGIDGFYGFLICICKDTACLRCVGYCESSEQSKIFSAVGATAGVIGSLQASAVLQIVLGNTDLYGKMFQFDATDVSLNEVEVRVSTECKAHK